MSHSTGFKNENLTTRGFSALRSAAVDADLIVFPGASDATEPVAYGWQLRSAKKIKDGEETLLPAFALADDESAAMLVFSDDFYIGDGHSIGWLQLLQIKLLALETNETMDLQEVIYVGKSADVASITDQVFFVCDVCFRSSRRSQFGDSHRVARRFPG